MSRNVTSVTVSALFVAPADRTATPVMTWWRRPDSLASMRSASEARRTPSAPKAPRSKETAMTGVAFLTDRVGQAVELRAAESLAGDLRGDSAAAISADGARVLTRGLSARVWDAETGTLRFELPHQVDGDEVWVGRRIRDDRDFGRPGEQVDANAAV